MRRSMNLLWLLVDCIYPTLHDVKYPRLWYTKELLTGIKYNGLKEFIKDQLDHYQYADAWRHFKWQRELAARKKTW